MVSMEDTIRYVRGERGMLPVRDPGIAIQEVRTWRKTEFDAGRPSTVADFYAAHHICPDCGGEGIRMIGWSAPRNDREFLAAQELQVQELPVYAVCARCGGGGTS